MKDSKLPLIVGLTGGIGSGKSTVARLFIDKGVPCYFSDDRAKWLMNFDESLKKSIVQLLGAKAYSSEGLDRKYVSSLVFENKELLSRLNQIVHPAVAQDFNDWVKQNNGAKFVLKEAAILFESGAYKSCDKVISVVAKESLRLQRVIERDALTKAQVESRMKNQWTDKQREDYSDYIIFNESDLKALELQVEKCYSLIEMYLLAQ